MAEMLILDREKAEKQLLITCVRDVMALLSDEALQIYAFTKQKDAVRCLENGCLLSMAITEIGSGEDIAFAEWLRQKQEHAEIFLVAESSISPMQYMTPKIRASSLLLRPFSRNQARQAMREYLLACHRKNLKESGAAIWIENREGKIAVPYADILFVEVRKKKLYVRTRDRQYVKYDSLENLVQKMPKHFFRCHRSFVVNLDYFVEVRFSENLIYLDYEITVPLSRTYRADLKERLYERYS